VHYRFSAGFNFLPEIAQIPALMWILVGASLDDFEVLQRAFQIGHPERDLRSIELAKVSKITSRFFWLTGRKD